MSCFTFNFGSSRELTPLGDGEGDAPSVPGGPSALPSYLQEEHMLASSTEPAGDTGRAKEQGGQGAESVAGSPGAQEVHKWDERSSTGMKMGGEGRGVMGRSMCHPIIHPALEGV